MSLWILEPGNSLVGLGQAICNTLRSLTNYRMSVREMNAHPLANARKFWTGRVENWAGRVEFYIEHIRVLRDICFQAKAPHIKVYHTGISDAMVWKTEVLLKKCLISAVNTTGATWTPFKLILRTISITNDCWWPGAKTSPGHQQPSCLRMAELHLASHVSWYVLHLSFKSS